MIITPYDIEAEKSVLGSILIDSSLVLDCELLVSDFYDDNNKILFENILKLHKKNIAIDLIALKNELEKENLLGRLGGMTSLIELTEIVPATMHFKNYEAIVKEKSQLRQIYKIFLGGVDKIKAQENSNDILSYLYNGMNAIEERIESKDENIEEIVQRTYEYICQIKEQDTVGISYGKQFKYLDVFTGGIQPGNIIRIGGGSNVGKTWLLLNLLLSILEIDDRITFFSLENDSIFTMKNFVGLKKGVNSLPANIKKHNIEFDEELLWFSKKKNFRIDKKTRKLDEIFRVALRNKSKYIFIDYIQKVKVPGKFFGPVQELAEYAFLIQEFAAKYGIVVFDLSQLSNEAQRNGVNGAGAGEFKGGGELKSGADVGIHIYEDKQRMEARESAIENGDMQDFGKNYLHIKISKNRLGPAGQVKDYILDFDKGGKYILDT